MPEIDVAALRLLEAKATPPGHTGWYVGTEDERLPGATGVWVGDAELSQVLAADSPATAQFVAALRNAAPALLDDKERADHATGVLNRVWEALGGEVDGEFDQKDIVDLATSVHDTAEAARKFVNGELERLFRALDGLRVASPETLDQRVREVDDAYRALVEERDG